ncbi:unnamed protein product [Calicophoron daubneyi]|uniref:IRS-type PTB domain-containing protein n=1 Tax=Calicophoron daubneyi TaxID=300641 RepID=A0AAV2TPU9_CALDB
MQPWNSVHYVSKKYSLRECPVVLAQLLNNAKVRFALLQTNCYLDVQSRVLNWRHRATPWTKGAIVEVAGPNYQAIDHCNRLIEAIQPFYSTRRPYIDVRLMSSSRLSFRQERPPKLRQTLNDFHRLPRTQSEARNVNVVPKWEEDEAIQYGYDRVDRDQVGEFRGSHKIQSADSSSQRRMQTLPSYPHCSSSGTIAETPSVTLKGEYYSFESAGPAVDVRTTTEPNGDDSTKEVQDKNEHNYSGVVSSSNDTGSVHAAETNETQVRQFSLPRPPLFESEPTRRLTAHSKKAAAVRASLDKVKEKKYGNFRQKSQRKFNSLKSTGFRTIHSDELIKQSHAGLDGLKNRSTSFPRTSQNSLSSNISRSMITQPTDSESRPQSPTSVEHEGGKRKPNGLHMVSRNTSSVKISSQLANFRKNNAKLDPPFQSMGTVTSATGLLTDGLDETEHSKCCSGDLGVDQKKSTSGPDLLCSSSAKSTPRVLEPVSGKESGEMNLFDVCVAGPSAVSDETLSTMPTTIGLYHQRICREPIGSHEPEIPECHCAPRSDCDSPRHMSRGRKESTHVDQSIKHLDQATSISSIHESTVGTDLGPSKDPLCSETNVVSALGPIGEVRSTALTVGAAKLPNEVKRTKINPVPAKDLQTEKRTEVVASGNDADTTNPLQTKPLDPQATPLSPQIGTSSVDQLIASPEKTPVMLVLEKSSRAKNHSTAPEENRGQGGRNVGELRISLGSRQGNSRPTSLQTIALRRTNPSKENVLNKNEARRSTGTPTNPGVSKRVLHEISGKINLEKPYRAQSSFSQLQASRRLMGDKTGTKTTVKKSTSLGMNSETGLRTPWVYRRISSKAFTQTSSSTRNSTAGDQKGDSGNISTMSTSKVRRTYYPPLQTITLSYSKCSLHSIGSAISQSTQFHEQQVDLKTNATVTNTPAVRSSKICTNLKSTEMSPENSFLDPQPIAHSKIAPASLRVSPSPEPNYAHSPSVNTQLRLSDTINPFHCSDASIPGSFENVHKMVSDMFKKSETPLSVHRQRSFASLNSPTPYSWVSPELPYNNEPNMYFSVFPKPVSTMGWNLRPRESIEQMTGAHMDAYSIKNQEILTNPPIPGTSNDSPAFTGHRPKFAHGGVNEESMASHHSGMGTPLSALSDAASLVETPYPFPDTTTSKTRIFSPEEDMEGDKKQIAKIAKQIEDITFSSDDSASGDVEDEMASGVIIIKESQRSHRSVFALCLPWNWCGNSY